jgi:hypothetical protein
MLSILKKKQNAFKDLPLKMKNTIYPINLKKNITIQNKSDKMEYNNLIYYPSASKE